MNESTIYNSNAMGAYAQGEETVLTNNDGQMIEEPRQSKSILKPVMIGGTAGLLVAGASVLAFNAYAGENNDGDILNEMPEGIQMAHGVTDDMSFDEAFAAAREEVGPGGVFEWHGNVYNTYLNSEWDAMTPEEQSDYAQLVEPLTRDSDYSTTAHHSSHHQDNDDAVVVNVTVEDNGRDEAPAARNTVENNDANNASNVNAIAQNNVVDDDDVSDVHFVTSTEVDGSPVDVYGATVHGHDAYILDVEQDGDPDIAMIDLNDDREFTEGEVLDMHTGELVSMGDEEEVIEDYVDDISEDYMIADDTVMDDGMDDYADNNADIVDDFDPGMA